MATRMQQRRGTAAQWAAADPILNAGEIGWESDTNKFKIGDGTNHWDDLTYFLDATDLGFNSADYIAVTQKGTANGVAALDANVNVLTTTGVVFEGTTADSYETILQVTDPTDDRTITLPNATGTVVTTGNLSAITSVGTLESLTISGNLTVNGTTTNINSTNLVVEDKNIVLADVATPSDSTADGGGITLKGATDKTFNWVDSTDSWTSSEHINLASGKSYYVNGTALKDVAETLTNKTLSAPTFTGTVSVGGAGAFTITSDSDIVLSSSTAAKVGSDIIATLTAAQTLTNKTLASAVATTALTLNATGELRLADTDSSHYVGFKAPSTISTNRIWTLPSADGSADQVLKTDGSGTLAWTTPAQGAAFSELMLIGA